MGNCLVWINSALDKNCMEEDGLDNPREIVEELISLIKNKCEKACAGVLAKLVGNLSGKGHDFDKILEIIW